MDKYICVHGHFYQPPRENPWLEEVEMQDSAYPYHDWNERITAECYAPNMAARILGPQDRIIDIINSYSKISFNFGPTLLSWLERHDQDVYQAILEADRLSQERYSGHGSAIAQVYNHMIMPLADSRDKATQVVWGIHDFESRFQRRPEGMWLSETAVDLETLDILAEQGIKFTILASHQARRVRKFGGHKWRDVSGNKIDTRMPYSCRLPSGKLINLFFYDGTIAQDVAFGGLLKNGENLAQRLLHPFSEEGEETSQLVNIATDGETYGHHHRYGDMALAYCMHKIESQDLARFTVYGEYLEKHPAGWEVEIFENTSWSCFHGVERWRSNCGCGSEMNQGWTQAWRAPLREAMDNLRDRLVPLYQEGMAAYSPKPWQVRDDYIAVILNRSPEAVNNFFNRNFDRPLEHEDKIRILKLLEMQRHAMLMYTSCGWFFDEISRIETLQVMQYAARTMQLAREVFDIPLEPEFCRRLREAPSNLTEYLHGEVIWQEYIKPMLSDLNKVSVHYAVSSLFEDYTDKMRIYCYTARQESFEREIRGEQKMAIGRVRVRSEITWEENHAVFAVMHLGGHNLVGGVRPYLRESSFDIMYQEIKTAFLKGDIPEMIRLADENFGRDNFSLWHLFRDEQNKILNLIMASALKETEDYFRHIYEHHYPIIQVMDKMHVPLPKILSTTVEFILNTDICRLLEGEQIDIRRLRNLAQEIKRWSFKRDKTTLGFIASRKITRMMEVFIQTPDELARLEDIEEILNISRSLDLELDVWKAQNLYYRLDIKNCPEIQAKAEAGDQDAQKWMDLFDRLGRALQVRRG